MANEVARQFREIPDRDRSGGISRGSLIEDVLNGELIVDRGLAPAARENSDEGAQDRHDHANPGDPV